MQSTNTLPEITLGQALRTMGLAFDTHVTELPGTPDIAFRESRLAVFVHGCYWHRHLRCARARTPRTNTFLWLRRFASNVQRDQMIVRQLRLTGWWTFVAWECEVLENPGSVCNAIVSELGRRHSYSRSSRRR
ncbi:hypothetical protein [Mycolicibacterium obuense]|uniref:hypothetical protein n=1 Tax=Mycolicibacterium obuense TaxID=1807 RepID=UPI0009E49556